MGIDDLADKAKGFLKSDKLEEVSDNVFDAVANAANKVTGGKFEDKIDGVRDTVDAKIGNEDGGVAASAEASVNEAAANGEASVNEAAANGEAAVNKAVSGAAE
jgi:hypothetical protein